MLASATSDNRMSLYKRKPAPASPSPSASASVDLEADAAEMRYPPFDLEDPFASLTELRRRSRSHSASYSFHCSPDLHHASGTAPFDLPPLSAKAFPSATQRRYTLTVAPPSSVSSPGVDALRLWDNDVCEISTGNSKLAADRQDAMDRLTTRSSAPELNTVGTVLCESKSSSIDGTAQRASHHDHHNRYAHIAMLFREASSAHFPQNGSKTTSTKSHYIPRKASTLSYMYTPPLTPDLSASSSSSGNSSSSSSLVDPPPMMLSNDKDVAPTPPKSPTPSAQGFVKRLLTKRSANNVTLRSKQSGESASLPGSPTPSATFHIVDIAPSTPPPNISAHANMSEVTLASVVPVQSSAKSSNGASPKGSIAFPSTDRDANIYANTPVIRPPGAELDAGLSPPRKHRLFSFSSRSLLRSKADLYQTSNSSNWELGSAQLSIPTFDEYALPTPKQLVDASSLIVVSESGVRVRFGDIWENEKTLVIFIRHFRATACQDYLRSIASEVDVKALEKAGLKIVIIGLGSHSLIAPYRQLTGTAFPIYTDPTLAVHRALGMCLRSTDRGSNAERGHYIISPGGAFGSLRRTLTGAKKLPLFERAGDSTQLGGEFVLGPGPGACAFAHRMRTTLAHAPILDVVEASGVQTARTRRVRGIGCGMRRESMEDEEAWMARRRRSLVRLRRKRQRRRILGRGEADAGAGGVRSESDVSDSKRDGRFPVVEEEEEEDDVYAAMLGI